MILGGINFALMYRAIVRRQPRAASRDAGAAALPPPARRRPVVLVAEIWTEDVVPGMDGDPRGSLHGGLDHDDDGILGRRLQHLADARADDDRRADVRGRLGGFDDRLGQGRAPPARWGRSFAARSTRPCTPRSSCRCASTGKSSTSGRSARSRRSFSSTSASSSSAPCVLAIDAARTGPRALGVRRGLGLGEHARERRPRLRHRRAARVVRAVQRLLDARDDRADVARPARDRSRSSSCSHATTGGTSSASRRTAAELVLLARLEHREHLVARPQHGRVLGELGAAAPHRPRSAARPSGIADPATPLARGGRISRRSAARRSRGSPCAARAGGRSRARAPRARRGRGCSRSRRRSA